MGQFITLKTKYHQWTGFTGKNKIWINSVGFTASIPYFKGLIQTRSQIELSKIALELDEKEQKLMSEAGNEGDLMKYLKVCIKNITKQEGSNNVADDGNFSIQVLTEALKKINQLSVRSVVCQDLLGQDIMKEEAFICNSASHWFALRKIKGIWYNLDSLMIHCPEIVNDEYVRDFLKNMTDFGFSIFAVQGQFPQNIIKASNDLQKHQRLFSSDAIQMLQETQNQDRQYLNDQQKLRQRNKRFQMIDEEFGDDEIYYPNERQRTPKKKIPAPVPLKISNRQQKQAKRPNYMKFNLDKSKDQEMAFMMLQSIEHKFQHLPEQGMNIQFLLPDGRLVAWIFSEDTTVEDLYDFVIYQKGKFQDFTLKNNDDEYLDVTKTLKKVRIEDGDVLMVLTQS